SNVAPLRVRRFRIDRLAAMALAAALALAIGFGAGYWVFAPGGGIRLAGAPAAGTDTGQYEAALYQALEHDSPGVEVSYADSAGRRGAVIIVGPIAGGVGGDCLEFRHEWSDAGRKVVSRGLACRSDTGEWSVLSMPPKPTS